MAESSVDVNVATNPGTSVKAFTSQDVNAKTVASQATTPADSLGREVVMMTEATGQAILAKLTSIELLLSRSTGVLP